MSRLHRACYTAILGILLMLLSLTGLPAPRGYAQDIPAQSRINGVVGHPQGHLLSCESRSASDWAAYFGVSIGEDQILEALPRSDNPEVGFVGSPDGPVVDIPPGSYGVYPAALADTLRGFGINAQGQRGMSWDDLRLEISLGRPVIVWIIGQMWPGQPVLYTAGDGQTVTVAYHEHTMIVTGYTEEYLYVIDALTGMDQVYELNAFFQSWAVLGQLALTLEGDPNAPPTQAEASAVEYVIQPGETLIGLAERFGLPWGDLAEYNQLTYPYLLYAGQTIRLPVGSPPVEAGPNFNPTLPTVEPEPRTTPADQPGTYRVVPGDTLIGIATRHGLTWREVVEINQIDPPYFLYAGQTLALP